LSYGPHAGQGHLSYGPYAGQGHLSYDPHGVRKLQSEPRYACLWT
jgi:hypothetical protein